MAEINKCGAPHPEYPEITCGETGPHIRHLLQTHDPVTSGLINVYWERTDIIAGESGNARRDILAEIRRFAPNVRTTTVAEELAALTAPATPPPVMIPVSLDLTDVQFEGSDYDPDVDDVRLSGQIQQVFALMQDGEWRIVSEIQRATGIPQDASISRHLRFLRAERFGGHTVNKRRRGLASDGLWEYQVLVAEPQPQARPLVDAAPAGGLQNFT